MSNDEQKLRVVLLDIYERRSEEIRVSPSWLATEAMVTLDGEHHSPPLVYLAAHLQLRQLARSICRRKFEDGDDDTEQHELFPNLQKRYPAAHSPDSEPEYVLLDHLSKDDVTFNVHRLRSEAQAKLRHADALEAWWQNRPQAAA
jgi:hypothetical protein